MELNELQEYQNKEWERIDEIRKKIDEPFSQLDCFPELELEKRKPYCSTSFPPSTLIPFHKTVFVKIPPLDQNEFKKIIQFNVEELIELEKRGRVAIILTQNPVDYLNLDYLDPIIEKNPPLSYRIIAYKEYLARDKLKQYGIEAECVFSQNPVWIFDNKWKNYIHGVEGFFVDLKVCGYHEIADYLVGLSAIEPEITKILTMTYAQILCGDLISYGGINPLEKEVLVCAAKVNAGIKGFQMMKIDNHSEIFPYEAGKFLTNQLRLIKPIYSFGDNKLEKTLEVYPLYEKARQALNSLDKAIEENNENKIQDSAMNYENEIQTIWNEVGKIEKESQKISETIQSIGIVGSITSPLLLGLPGILASLGFSIFSHRKIAEPISGYLSKVKKNANIVTVYEFKKEVDEWNKTTG